MRVLLVSHVAPPHIGGVEQAVWAEAQQLLEAGHEVAWVTSDGGGAGERPWTHPRLRIVRIEAWHVMERLFGIAYPFHAPRLLPVLWSEVGRADVVHVHGLVFEGSVAAAAFARLRRRACLLTDHGGILRFRSRVGTWCLRVLIETVGRLTARCADRLISVNPEIELLLRRLGGRDAAVRLLANPVSRTLFTPPSPVQRRAARRRLGWDRRPRVLFVGRMLPHKGVEVLLAAAEPSIALAFCGPADPQLVARIRRSGAEYLEPRPQRELVTLYHAADVLALPSRNEGFPCVVQEALACGLPVVTTDGAAYALHRSVRGLHLCRPTAQEVRAAIRRALGRRRPAGAAPPPRAMAPDGRSWLSALLEGIA